MTFAIPETRDQRPETRDQGPGTTLAAYTPRTRSAWKAMRLLFAGEIIVNVKTCTYFINEGSETYRPSAGKTRGSFEYLEQVANLFKEKVGAPPELLWDTQAKTSRRFGAGQTIPGCVAEKGG